MPCEAPLLTSSGSTPMDIMRHNHASGSPGGSTPVDVLLQSPWQHAISSVDKGEESSQDPPPYTQRPRNYLIARTRVSEMMLYGGNVANTQLTYLKGHMHNVGIYQPLV